MASTTTVAGVKFSDTLAALLDHAEANGYRIEHNGERGQKVGVVLYSPDKTIAPISVAERGAKFNPSHYDNIKSQLTRAGLPPLPTAGDETPVELAFPESLSDIDSVHISKDPTAAEKHAAATGAHVHRVIPGVDVVSTDPSDDLSGLLKDQDRGPDFLESVVAGIASQMGLGKAEVDLVSRLTAMTAAWAIAYSPDRIGEAAEKADGVLAARMGAEVTAALKLAEEAEAKAARAIKALEKAEASEVQARKDCGDAIARAKAAEAKATELEAAIAPLRNLLGKA